MLMAAALMLCCCILLRGCRRQCTTAQWLETTQATWPPCMQLSSAGSASGGPAYNCLTYRMMLCAVCSAAVGRTVSCKVLGRCVLLEQQMPACFINTYCDGLNRQRQFLRLFARSCVLHAPSLQSAQAPVAKHCIGQYCPPPSSSPLPCCSNCSFIGNNASNAAAFGASGSAAAELRFSAFYNNTASTDGAAAILAGTSQVSNFRLLC